MQWVCCAVLGFEDCSAKTEDITAAQLTLAKPYIKEHEELTPKAWSFYGFDVTPDDYQVVIDVSTEVSGKDDACTYQISTCLPMTDHGTKKQRMQQCTWRMSVVSQSHAAFPFYTLSCNEQCMQ